MSRECKNVNSQSAKKNISGGYTEDFALQLEAIFTNKQLIASQAEHLHRLRATGCHPVASQLAQQEIRNVEEKILKLFGLQVVSKQRLPKGLDLPAEVRCQPSVRQWLEVVGLRKDSVEGLYKHITSLEELLSKNETILNIYLAQLGVPQNHRDKLFLAVKNLRLYKEFEEKESNINPPSKLYWDSWEIVPRSQTPHRSSVSSEGEGRDWNLVSSEKNYGACRSPRGSDAFLPSSPPSYYLPPSPGPTSNHSLGLPPTTTGQDKRYTPPPTPPVISKGKPGERKPTPPPSKKNMLQNAIKQNQSISSSTQSIGRSTSHESRLSMKIEQEAQQGNEQPQPVPPVNQNIPRRVRLQSDSEVSGRSYTKEKNLGSWGDITEEHNSFSKSFKHMSNSADDGTNKKVLVMPGRKTTVAGSMGHNVQHRFTLTLKREVCGYCKKKIPFPGGLKCKECQFKCHRECKSKLAPACGLPPKMLEYFITERVKDFEKSSQEYQGDALSSKGQISISQPSINHYPSFQTQDSSSNTSSCNSSTPSSPALIVPSSPMHKAFIFADKDKWDPPQVAINNNIEIGLSLDSEKTMSATSNSGSTTTEDSDRTMALDSQDCEESRCHRQNSVSSVNASLREWDIPYDELIRDDVIGKGQFGTVYSGKWHGQVAIKELNMDHVNDEKALEAFKAEISTFRKTRHENLVLFMGACMKPPRLAIVTSFVKGFTLYQHIHVMKEKFTMTRTIPISRQIVQGMSYLHARGIIHKDVKTKNIFLETNEKVVITDFGLFNVTRLCYNRKGPWLSIPHGWLCYLAPEVMRSLRLNPRTDDTMPFTTYSDVFAFGTVWYELLCGEWPHKNLPPEAVIWQVGKGMKPSLAHLHASRNVKDILMQCWSYTPEDRPEFSSLLEDFRKLPKKRLDRSPSHPVQLSRSAESVF